MKPLYRASLAGKNISMAAPFSFGSRKVANRAVTLYVSPDGRDCREGARDDYERCFDTIQGAVNALMWDWDLRGCPATIKVADGVYSESIQVRGVPLGSTSRPAIIFIGNVGNSSRCILHAEAGHAFENWGGHVEISGFKFTTKQGACIYAHDSGRTFLGPVEFGEAGREHIVATAGHIVKHKSDYTISGGATMHAHITDSALYGNGKVVTLTGQPHFGEEFHGLNFARARWAGTKFIGTATGKRHVVHWNAVCSIGGAAPDTFFPGDRPGVVRNFSTMA